MLYKYIDKILSFCDRAERQNWTTYEAIQYIKDNIKRLSDDEMIQHYCSMSDKELVARYSTSF